MIDLISLSRGNYVYSKIDNKCGEVTDIYTSKSGVDTVGLIIRKEKVYRNPQDLTDICISADWLWYLGFNRHNDKGEFTEMNPLGNAAFKIEISHGDIKVRYNPLVLHHRELSLIRLRYVHQLQNLYHMVTHNPLKIKNPFKKPVHKSMLEEIINPDNELYG